MTRTRLNYPAWALLLAVSLGFCPDGGAFAQMRSDTGRHKVAERQPEPGEAAKAPQDSRDRLWSLGLSLGGMGGSRLFEVESLTGNPILWDPPAGPPFNATRFEGTLETNLNLELSLGRDLGSWVTARTAFSYSQMDLSAEALQGEDGTILLFARPDVYMLALGVRFKLTQRPSHPFLATDLVWVTLANVGGTEELGQSNLGYRLGGGYMQVLSPAINLRLEGRFTRNPFDIGDYHPDTPMHDQETYQIEGAKHLSFFEVLIGVEFRP